MDNTTSTVHVGCSGTLLGLLFITLKLLGVITWPWIWVLCPIWIPWALVLAVLAIVALLAIVAAIL